MSRGNKLSRGCLNPSHNFPFRITCILHTLPNVGLQIIIIIIILMQGVDTFNEGGFIFLQVLERR